jgi:aarF domain-containing kinase
VTEEWGIGTPDLFASATLLRPVHLKNGNGNGGAKQGEVVEKLDQYEQSVRMKARLKAFLTDTDKWPKELIFLGRNMRFVHLVFLCLIYLIDILVFVFGRMVQGNNQSLGSPVNRIKITGYWASRSLTSNRNLTLPQRVREYWYYIVFRGVMLSLDLAFLTSRVRGWVRRRMGLMSEGFEDELERSM